MFQECKILKQFLPLSLFLKDPLVLNDISDTEKDCFDNDLDQSSGNGGADTEAIYSGGN